MLRKKKARLDAADWTEGSTREFPSLSEAETGFIELKLGLSGSLRERRRGLRLSQANLAKRLRCSASRVAKMEAGDPSISLDLLVRSLLVLGASSEDIARAIRAGHRAA
jgi:DNA-binding XRE family transcriptional regulator